MHLSGGERHPTVPALVRRLPIDAEDLSEALLSKVVLSGDPADLARDSYGCVLHAGQSIPLAGRLQVTRTACRIIASDVSDDPPDILLDLSGNWYSPNMSNIAQLHPSVSDEKQAARAQFLSDTLKADRWSLRLLQQETGIPKSTLASKLNGSSPILAADIELFAEVLRRDPVGLFADYLSAGTKKGPEGGASGPSLPGLDSNQEPIGSQPSNVTRARFGKPERAVTPRPVVAIAAR